MFSFKKYTQNEYLKNMLHNEMRYEVIALRITYKDDFCPSTPALYWAFLSHISFQVDFSASK